jgi:hypothetical protein
MYIKYIQEINNGEQFDGLKNRVSDLFFPISFHQKVHERSTILSTHFLSEGSRTLKEL